MSDSEYKGWTNFQTYHIYQGLFEGDRQKVVDRLCLWASMSIECSITEVLALKEQNKTNLTKSTLIEHLKKFIEDMVEDMLKKMNSSEDRLVTDIVKFYIKRVNYHEIAEKLIDAYGIDIL